MARYSTVIALRLTQAEALFLRGIAAREGLTITQLIRGLLRRNVAELKLAERSLVDRVE